MKLKKLLHAGPYFFRPNHQSMIGLPFMKDITLPLKEHIIQGIQLKAEARLISTPETKWHCLICTPVLTATTVFFSDFV